MHTTAPPVAPKRKRIPVWAWIVSGIAALMLLYGVSASPAGNDSPAPIPNSSAGASSPAPIPNSTGASSSSKNVFHFGDTASLGGFAVMITPVEGYVYTYDDGPASAFQVTVRNDSNRPVDLFELMFDANIQGGQPAERVFDSAHGVGIIPTGELFPTETATFRVAFQGAVARVKVERVLDFFSDPVYFVP